MPGGCVPTRRRNPYETCRITSAGRTRRHTSGAAWAPHTWTGFSTGNWVGNTLAVETTHLKDGFLRRGGPQTSDMLTMAEYLTRHDDLLTIVQVTDDPLYMDEPFVQSQIYHYDPTTRVNMETCNAATFAESGGTHPHFVPHHLPGRELFIDEWLPSENWIPFDAVRGGVNTIYLEYRTTLDGSVDAADVAYYRNMVQIVSNRIQALIDEGMSLDEVQAAHPTMDFDPRYGSDTGDWTVEMFVEAVYRSLTEL